MAYLKPPMITSRIFNPIAMRLGLGGATALAVTGRSSGQTETVPVIPVERDGARYIVSTRGESDWVRNVRAAGTVELRSKHGTTRYRATEIPAAERPPIIADYRKAAGRYVGSYWKSLPDPADHPTFRLDPA